MSEQQTFSIGSLINNRYRILKHIGGGAMARVYQVEHVELGTVHALKVQCEQEGDDANYFSEIARREAQFLTSLAHQSLPRVTDLFREGNCIFLVMDFIEGQNLKHFIEQNAFKTLEIPTVLQWGIQIAEVLDYLHNQKPPVIFRDVKPSNLIRRPDDALCLVDFGIARRARRGARADTVVLGSPGYAPPEQYGRDQTTPRSDIYAFGATMHHLLTGRDPSIAPFQWPPIRDLNPAVPLVLEKLIMRCLEVEPNNRPESAKAVGDALLKIQEQLKVAIEPSLASNPSLVLITESAYKTKELEPDALDALDPEPSGELNTAPDRSLQLEALPPLEIPRYVPATLAAKANLSFPSPAVAPSPIPARSERSAGLFTVLKACVVVALLGCGVIGFAGSALEPPRFTEVAPIKPEMGAPPEAVQKYERAQTEYLQAQQSAERKRTLHQRLVGARFGLIGLICLAFFFGTLLPSRPTKLGMLATLAGIFCLILLTGATLLPAQAPLFIALVIIEAALFYPALSLFFYENS